MKTMQRINSDGSITIKTSPNVSFVFTTISAAVNFCNDYNLKVKF